MLEVILGVIFFSTIVLALVFVIIGARSQLVSSGDVSIEINHDSANSLVTAAGSRLLQNPCQQQYLFIFSLRRCWDLWSMQLHSGIGRWFGSTNRRRIF